MKRIQYTIRSIPPTVDSKLREHAKRTGKSLNEVAVEALKAGAGVSGKPVTYTELDSIFGAGIADCDAFDDAQNWQEALPNPLMED